jgi:hypothetical protein
MMSDSASEAAILRDVQSLDDKLSKALTRQTDALTKTIQQLADRHNDAMLGQEKRNATFADRDRVESVAEHGHAIASHVQTLSLRVGTLETDMGEMQAREGVRFRDRVALIAGVGGPVAAISAVLISHFWS